MSEANATPPGPAPERPPPPASAPPLLPVAAPAVKSAQALEAECDLEFFTAGGPGGQHRNKTESAVRLRHRDTGIVVSATERRSQSQNLGVAIERMRAALQARFAPPPPPRRATRPTRGSRERRLTGKKVRAGVKAGRGKVGDE